MDHCKIYLKIEDKKQEQGDYPQKMISQKIKIVDECEYVITNDLQWNRYNSSYIKQSSL